MLPGHCFHKDNRVHFRRQRAASAAVQRQRAASADEEDRKNSTLVVEN